MIGIIGAMDAEVLAIREKMTDISEENVYNINFVKGKIKNKEVVLCKSGVGKVNASFTTTILLTKFNIEYVVNIGTAGGLDKNQNTLDIVISDRVIQHDFDTSYIDGPDARGIFSESDKKLVEKLKNQLESNSLDYKVYIGNIISGDIFVGETEKIEELKSVFPSAIACEMESGAIGQVCERLNVPFIVIRSLSDIVHHDNSGIDFMKNLQITSKRSADMLENFM